MKNNGKAVQRNAKTYCFKHLKLKKLRTIKNFDSQSEFTDYEELKHLKWQKAKQQGVLIINRTILLVDVDTNLINFIVIFLAIALGVNSL